MESDKEIPRTCPHCGSGLKKWRTPEGASWEEPYFLVCFNDACTYYREGWDWMLEQFGQRASYRYAFSPRTGSSTMIPVWSDAATREMIQEQDDSGKGD